MRARHLGVEDDTRASGLRPSKRHDAYYSASILNRIGISVTAYTVVSWWTVPRRGGGGRIKPETTLISPITADLPYNSYIAAAANARKIDRAGALRQS